jgi:hypothetical protein
MYGGAFFEKVKESKYFYVKCGADKDITIVG